ncbi:hypothetical protein F444_23232 [Phytophthora nicotianae P1976]|uniref:Uncharacterized protein n=1 Tax=Phytophthora nicotianae P1976 TaxID=1317066 RepID=A0A080YVI0_PHYNI|nr:hypothetical protein F444_23232 [Phytophthora nicotianae P1976]
MAPPKAPMAVYHELRREKKLRLSKFGLDDPKLAVKVWLVAMKNELRRQATVLKTEWRENEVFIGMVANLEVRLRLRLQQCDEPLVEYAQQQREIASCNPDDESRLVGTFVFGIANT